MTLYIDEEELTMNIGFNQPNLNVNDLYFFTITSQYSHKPEVLFPMRVVSSNSRWSLLQVTFPTGFGDEHKNGVYYYELREAGATTLEKGLVKIITNPGGAINTLAYNSGAVTEERISDVYFRPNY